MELPSTAVNSTDMLYTKTVYSRSKKLLNTCEFPKGTEIAAVAGGTSSSFTVRSNKNSLLVLKKHSDVCFYKFVCLYTHL